MVRAAPHRGLIGRSLQSDCSAAVHGSIAGGNEGTRRKKESKKKGGESRTWTPGQTEGEPRCPARYHSGAMNLSYRT